MFGFGHHHKDQAPPASGPNQIFKIYCRASEDYCLAVRDGEVVLAPVNPKDETQHWLKDMRFSTTVKDEEGMPAFALVNKATGLAVKHSIGKLVPFNPAYEDASVLWTESKDMGKGFRCIRMVNNTRLGFDALNGDKDHGGVHDGTTVVLWEWCKGDNQCWKIWPWAEAHAAVESGATMGNNAHAMGGGPPVHAVRVFCKAGEDYSLTARNGTVCLAPTNPRDDSQQQDQGRGRVPCVRTGEHGHRRMHQALHRPGVKLVPYNPAYQDESVLWTESRDVGKGFRCVRMVNNIYLNFDAFHGDKAHGGVHDGTEIVLWKWCEGDNQRWKILPW
ncbi:unnamed protein product [Triticum turgidum subsp. durum]|uniref:Hydroxyproline-rich glycoprotein family protein n=1 Tax=Triticum turgidum subsp. durum TaxID=4567 RepID=A0A9R1NJZ1_TRITD|nr:unnamed protein product [Triticum turgidum subsp. durum]